MAPSKAMAKLREKVIRLAASRPDLRPHLMPLLKKSSQSVDAVYKQMKAAGWKPVKNDSVYSNPYTGEVFLAHMKKRFGATVEVMVSDDGIEFVQGRYSSFKDTPKNIPLNKFSTSTLDKESREMARMLRKPRRAKPVTNQQMDAAVYHVLSSYGTDSAPFATVKTITDAAFDEYRPAWGGGPYFISGIDQKSVLQSLQRLARKGLVHRWDGKGNLGLWAGRGSGLGRLKYWATYEQLVKDRRYADDFGNPDNVPRPKSSPPSPPKAWNPNSDDEGQVPRVYPGYPAGW